MNPPKKRRPCPEVDAIGQLKNYGDLCLVVNDNGQLPNHVKELLAQITPEEFQQYMRRDNNQGQRLFAEICRKGDLDAVRYAVEVLQLNKLPTVDSSSFEVCFCPVCSALRVRQPQVEVVRYLTEQGCKVSKRAFILWALVAPRQGTDLRSLLQPLIEYGQDELPLASSLLYYGSIEHVRILADYITFTYGDMREAALRGNTGVVDFISTTYKPQSPEQCDELADIFELCEVSRYLNSREAFYRLTYFRRSLDFRPNGRATVGRSSYSRWKLFQSSVDIDRLEWQMLAGDYVETAWQILLTAARLRYPLDRLYTILFWGLRVRNLGELAKMKFFVLSDRNFPQPPELGRRQSLVKKVLFTFWCHCITIIRRIPSPQLSILPDMYICFNELFEFEIQSWQMDKIRETIDRMSVTNITEQVRSLRLWHNESLAIVARLYDSSRSGSTTELIIRELLAQGASLMKQPELRSSTLSLLVKNNQIMPERLLRDVAANVCCKMDLRPAQRAVFRDNISHLNVPSLRCLASVACQRLPSRTVKGNLPPSLVYSVKRHPDPKQIIVRHTLY